MHDRVRRLLQELIGDGPDLPPRLVDLCSDSLPVTGVGLSWMTADDRSAGLVAASDGVAVRLDDLQFTLGEGPCVDASRSGRPVLVPDLASRDPVRGSDGRWPGFTPEALAEGVAAVFALPLRVGGIRVGVLDLYRDVPGPLPEVALADALAFAGAATSLLLHLQVADPDGGTPAPWTTSLADYRAIVHQATGIVSVTAGISLTDALVRLRALAWSQRRPVDEVSGDIVAGRLRVGPT